VNWLEQSPRSHADYERDWGFTRWLVTNTHWADPLNRLGVVASMTEVIDDTHACGDEGASDAVY
jgi:hypothetical protein